MTVPSEEVFIDMNEKKLDAQSEIDRIIASIETDVRVFDASASDNPFGSIKTSSRQLRSKTSALGSEVESLETCLKYDKGKIVAQCGDVRESIRDVLIFAIELEIELFALESRMGVASDE